MNHAEILKIKCSLQNIKKKIKIFEKLESTNSFMLNDPRCKNGSVVCAKIQTKGKGRLNRTWVSKPGSLCFSVCFIIKNKNKIATEIENSKSPAHLTSGINLVSALAVVKALEDFGIQNAKIKWPNDVYLTFNNMDVQKEIVGKNHQQFEKNPIENFGKKVCGILTQTQFEKKKIKIVLGIGLNVNQNIEAFPEELRSKATSLKISTSKTYDLNELLKRILCQLDSYIALILNDGNLTHIATELKEKSFLKNKTLKIEYGKDTFIGDFIGFTDYGGLKIKCVSMSEIIDSSIKTLYAGEIIQIL